jgi:hypothetical protein
MIEAGHRYISNRRHCLDYPRALQLGLPIGSGMIEVGHCQSFRLGSKWLALLGYTSTPTK